MKRLNGKSVYLMASAFLISGLMTACAGEKTTATTAAVATTAAATEKVAETAVSVYPEKEVQVIVTAAAGGGTDALARAVCSPLEKQLGKSMVIINEGAASGLVGMSNIAASEPDGYTLGVFSNTDVANFVYTNPETDFALDSFTYIAALNQTGDLIVLKKDSPYADLETFLAYAKEHPGEITIGLPSAIQNLSLNLFNKGMSVETTGIVYEGGNKVFSDLIGGHIDAGILSAKFIGQCEDQNITVLGLMLAERLDTYPDIKTFKEQGYDINNAAARMLVGPAGMPQEVKDRLVAELEAGYEGDIAEALRTIGESPVLLTGEELDQFLTEDFAMREDMLKQ
ncbi:MAG: tripartite tricarboxylate transporter substrate binding protein [Lachnospiraceae bacterium]|nr:tripartite tricarboxylate transporter substrate binding protein [Lachnospiraceae bacterium]